MKQYFKLSQIRKAFILVILFCLSTVVYAQQQIIKHTVDRGETLVSIAKAHGITVEKIIELNPEAAQFIYVGMILNIPKVTDVTNEMTPNTDKQKLKKERREDLSNYKTNEEIQATNDDEGLKGFAMCMDIGWGKPKGKGCWSYRVALGVNYFFTNEIYAGAKVGYNSSNSNAYYDGYITDSKVHMLVFPLELGYRFLTSNNNWGLVPYAGFDINIALSGKYKFGKGSDQESTDMKIGGKVGVAGVIGARIKVYDFALEAGYHLPITDKQKMFFGKDGYPEIKLSWGI